MNLLYVSKLLTNLILELFKLVMKKAKLFCVIGKSVRLHIYSPSWVVPADVSSLSIDVIEVTLATAESA